MNEVLALPGAPQFFRLVTDGRVLIGCAAGCVLFEFSDETVSFIVNQID